MGVTFEFEKDELVVSSGGPITGRYIVGKNGLGPGEAERLSHDLLMMADSMYAPRQDAPERLEPETAVARGEDPSEAGAVKSVEPTKPGNTVKGGAPEDQADKPESRSSSSKSAKK